MRWGEGEKGFAGAKVSRRRVFRWVSRMMVRCWEGKERERW